MNNPARLSDAEVEARVIWAAAQNTAGNKTPVARRIYWRLGTTRGGGPTHWQIRQAMARLQARGEWSTEARSPSA